MTLARTDNSRTLTRLAIAVVLLMPFIVYFGTARSIVEIWNSSETFAHGYIILPISFWLIWKRRATLAQMEPTPYWPGLLLLLACGFGWLLADLGSVQVVRQYTFMAMMPLAVVAVLGLRISWLLAFPLFFMLFSVPFGEIFIDPLINYTADFTVSALQATGIPVLRDGASFSIPSGNWSVVEACSGVRYLISSVTLGSLYAYLTYRSHIRQALFVALSIVVPVIANGLRAYMIVMIGHLSEMKYAVGFDHLIYGWLFFGLVMFLMFWIGSYWREDEDELPANAADAAAMPATSAVPPARIYAACAAAIVCISIWPAYAKYIEHVGFNPQPADVSNFKSTWQEAAGFTEWKPVFFTGDAELFRYFQHDGQVAGLALKYYRNQHHGAELISSTNLLGPHEENPRWRRVSTSLRTEVVGDRTMTVRESVVHGGLQPLLVWQWYWIEGKVVTNDYAGKLMQAKTKFLMGGDDGAAVLVFAQYADKPDEARAVLRAFLASNLPPLESTLAGNKKR